MGIHQLRKYGLLRSGWRRLPGVGTARLPLGAGALIAEELFNVRSHRVAKAATLRYAAGGDRRRRRQATPASALPASKSPGRLAAAKPLPTIANELGLWYKLGRF